MATADVLAHLAGRLTRMRLLVVVTYLIHDLIRDGDPFLAVRDALVARAPLEEVNVGPLTPDDVREYVSRVCAGTKWPSGLPALIFRRSQATRSSWPISSDSSRAAGGPATSLARAMLLSLFAR